MGRSVKERDVVLFPLREGCSGARGESESHMSSGETKTLVGGSMRCR